MISKLDDIKTFHLCLLIKLLNILEMYLKLKTRASLKIANRVLRSESFKLKNLNPQNRDLNLSRDFNPLDKDLNPLGRSLSRDLNPQDRLRI